MFDLEDLYIFVLIYKEYFEDSEGRPTVLIKIYIYNVQSREKQI